MPRHLVRVNIHNRGKLFGLETPAYNVPLDYETYQLFKEMGFNIEIAYPEVEDYVKPQKLVEPEVEKEEVLPKKRPYKKREYLSLDGFTAKDHYEEEELKNLTNAQLTQILNYRGHFGRRTGKRDKLAPKYEDTKAILIKKIILTNIN